MARSFRFGQFDLDPQTGELRKGPRTSRLQDQPLKILLMLLESPGALVTREEMKQRLWAEDTFVDFEHSLSAAINKLRTALGDSATDSRYIETLPRKGYRFIAPVQLGDGVASVASPKSGVAPNQAMKAEDSDEPESPPSSWSLTQPEEVPQTSKPLALGIFAAIQIMYLIFSISALAGLRELQDRLANLGAPGLTWIAVIALAVIGIPVRLYLLSSVGFRAQSLRRSFLKIFPFVFVLDEVWAASPLLIVDHIGWGWALTAVAGLAYLPFSQRTLLLMAERRR